MNSTSTTGAPPGGPFPKEQHLKQRLALGRGQQGHPVLARNSWVCQWSEGERSTPADAGWPEVAQRMLMPWSTAVCVSTEQPDLALTFDDGPDPRYTPQVLDALAAHQARATFFMLSSAARRFPQTVRRVVAEGHEVALHGVDHERMTRLTRAECTVRLRRGVSELEDVSGIPITMYRPTYGAQHLGLVRAAHGLGLETVLWSGWAEEWLGGDATEIAQRAFAACHRGGILLLHDALEGLLPGEDPVNQSPEVTRLLLGDLGRQGWRSVPAGELLRNHQHIRSAWFERPTLRRRQQA